MTFRNCVAVDLGASSGRVMLARYERGYVRCFNK